MSLRSPYPYFGGKREVAALVWERLGNVPNFVEPCFGSGAVLLARPHTPNTETINDADGLLVNFWRAVRAEPEAVAERADWPVSECDLHARHLWLVNEGKARTERLKTDPEFYDVQAAGWWVWGICQWIGSGWCSGQGPHRQLGDLAGVAVQLPHVGDAGMGVHRKLPHVGDAGRGRADLFRERLEETFCELFHRLRHVRICCGDWARVVGPSVTERHGITGVFLDPPYSHAEREQVYAHDQDVAGAVREWAIANGDNPLLRIAVCGYGTEHDFPTSWERVHWKARGGYGSQGEGRGRENAVRETIWFNKSCLRTAQGLFADEVLA